MSQENVSPPSTPPGPSPDMVALAAGQEIHEYRIDKVLGGGGFGITYLAQDVNLQLPVAIKEYFPSDVAVRGVDTSVKVRNEDCAERFNWGLDRFVDEARALASFRHPNIVRVLRYFKDNGTAYIVMDYESGDPLKHWVVRQNGLDQEGLLQLMYPLLDGLEAVHKLNFLHRDIKPDNIYIRADGSPVLLDFGAARRVTTAHDMTNIVSPGFAPFEQYHAKGNQGPWTDLYSLGAVMYWLTTGRKPLEAASRVREDPMEKAQNVANRSVFSIPLLQAIDWCLSPHEQDRPQTVAQLREALHEVNYGKTQVLSRVTTRVMDVANTPSVKRNEDSSRKNVMGTIMFLDLVAYSKHSVDQQVALKTLFNELIAKAIDGVDPTTRIMLDTGDGAAICFLGDPEEALLSARLLRDLLQQKYPNKLSMRVGLHLGPLRLLKDLNNRTNVVGDGINVAQRIMDFSNANEITVSRAYFDVVSRISEDAERHFEYLGERLDKHQRAHELYRLREHGAESDDTDEEATTLFMVQPISDPELQVIEAELTRLIGPLAHILVKKTVKKAVGAQNLRELLSVSVQDVASREAFIYGRSVHTGQTTTLGPSSSASSRSISQPISRSMPQSASRPLSQPVSGVSSPTGRTVLPNSAPVRSEVTGVLNFGLEVLDPLERLLSQSIGPLARTLVRREAKRVVQWDQLVHVLAQQIDKSEDRKAFVAAATKIRHG
jgi:serine/threonine protein kinase